MEVDIPILGEGIECKWVGVNPGLEAAVDSAEAAAHCKTPPEEVVGDRGSA